ncbi:MAG: hypothetical protein ACTSRZ_12000, partial [Promethearchaeota archaeon]
MAKYYKYQKPGKAAFKAFFISLFVKLPFTTAPLLETIVMAALGDDSFNPNNFIAIPILLAIFIFLLIFKKKHPRSVAIFSNAYVLLIISYSLGIISVESTQLIGNLLTDSDTVIQGLNDGEEFFIRMVVTGSIGLFLFIIGIRTIGKLKKSFADCEPESDSVIIILWVLIIVIHVLAVLLAIGAFFTDPIHLIGESVYAPMFGLLKYLFPVAMLIYLALSAFKTIKEFKLKGRRNKLGFKEAMVFIIFGFSLFPIFGHFIDHGLNHRPNSVFNTSWSGNSEFKRLVESKGYETYSIQSSLSAMLSLNRSIVMVIFGPTSVYNPLSEIPFFLDLLNRPNTTTSFLICDDHGSTKYLTTEMAVISQATDKKIPWIYFTEGILKDNASCLTDSSNKKDNNFPIIQNLASHPTTNGVNKVLLSYATTIVDYEGLIEGLGWTVLGRTSPLYSFVDRDLNGYFNGDKDYWGIDDELNFTLWGMEISIEPRIELAAGDTGLPVFAAYEIDSNNRIFVTSDASLFNNELIYEYDNYKFASNIIDWLAGGASDVVFVFDESHNIPRGMREFSSAAMFGLIQGYINWLSTNPFLSWLYPLYALRLLRKYVPKESAKKKKKKKKKEEELEEEELKFRTSSFFARKINWYRINKKYNQALTYLYRRIERRLHKLIGDAPLNTDNIIEMIEISRGKYINKENIKRMRKFLEKMEQ